MRHGIRLALAATLILASPLARAATHHPHAPVLTPYQQAVAARTALPDSPTRPQFDAVMDQFRAIYHSNPADVHAPDSIFFRALHGAYDMVVAMYHDQGHIPMKLIDFEQTVNISLGIPIIRTSVDHGTAFDIAGKNKADARNLMTAIEMAARMASRKRAARVQAV